MKKIITNNLKTTIFFICIVLFIFIAILLLRSKLILFDEFIYKQLSKFTSLKITKFMKLCFSILFIFHNSYGVCIMINVFLTVILNLILKNIFMRDRPNNLRLIIESGYSFPSGHSMASISLYGYLMYLAHKKINNKLLKTFIYLILGNLILLVGISRIYLGVHYASDVIAGFLISTAILLFFIKITDKYVKY